MVFFYQLQFKRKLKTSGGVFSHAQAFPFLPGRAYYRGYAQGMKTGFTTQAGRCFVTFASQNGRTYGLVILGSNSQNIFREAAELFDWAFANPDLQPKAAPETKKHSLFSFWQNLLG